MIRSVTNGNCQGLVRIARILEEESCGPQVQKFFAMVADERQDEGIYIVPGYPGCKRYVERPYA